MNKWAEVSIVAVILFWATYLVIHATANQKCFKDEGVDVIYWRWETSKRLCGLAYMESFTMSQWEVHVENGPSISGLGGREEAERFIGNYCPTK